MKKKEKGIGLRGARELGLVGEANIFKAVGVVIAQQTSVPIDYESAQKERELEQKFGRTVFGTRIPKKFLDDTYFNMYPDDSQSRLSGALI